MTGTGSGRRTVVIGALAVMVLWLIVRFPFDAMLIFFAPGLPATWVSNRVLPEGFLSFALGPVLVYVISPLFWFALIFVTVRQMRR